MCSIRSCSFPNVPGISIDQTYHEICTQLWKYPLERYKKLFSALDGEFKFKFNEKTRCGFYSGACNRDFSFFLYQDSKKHSQRAMLCTCYMQSATRAISEMRFAIQKLRSLKEKKERDKNKEPDPNEYIPKKCPIQEFNEFYKRVETEGRENFDKAILIPVNEMYRCLLRISMLQKIEAVLKPFYLARNTPFDPKTKKKSFLKRLFGCFSNQKRKSISKEEKTSFLDKIDFGKYLETVEGVCRAEKQRFCNQRRNLYLILKCYFRTLMVSGIYYKSKTTYLDWLHQILVYENSRDKIDAEMRRKTDCEEVYFPEWIVPELPRLQKAKVVPDKPEMDHFDVDIGFHEREYFV
ncbi:hypothetical protein MHBO_000521 [Bonamia ostreae]|uniref:Uncharacterized protein n=1 Tax=Bonamia ostreae TaxID=126728 RepID=A0ABV2AGI9_9EUKA